MTWTASLEPYFKWILVLHVLSFTSWMAGIFYIPRLFVYHTMVKENETAAYDRFCTQEHKLLYMIMLPASLVALISGALMSAIPGVVDWNSAWWWIKVAGIFGLFAFQGWCKLTAKNFANHANQASERSFRIMNEVPTILMIIIVVMIIVRP